jgi:hypothetical protein
MKSETKHWGRIGDAMEILGVGARDSAERVLIAAGVAKRKLPGRSHALYDLNRVREVCEQSTRPATVHGRLRQRRLQKA